MTELARSGNAGLVERIAVARDVVDRTDVRAPQDGVVQDLRVQRVHFLGRIEVLPDAIPSGLADSLQPGMPAEIIIPTEERTVLSYLVRPLTDAVAKGFRERLTL